MSESSQAKQIWHYDHAENLLSEATRQVVSEHTCKLVVNGEDWISFICSPTDLEAMAIGFLWNEGVIGELSEIESLTLSEDASRLEVTINRGIAKPQSFHRTSTGIALDTAAELHQRLEEFNITAHQILELYRQFNSLQKLHDEVGGFHSGGLSDSRKVQLVVEDLGRHNCVDKLAGLYLLSGKPYPASILLLSGRISSEMVAKSNAMGVEMIISRTSPTTIAIELAEQVGITLVGYLRGNKFEIYSHPGRIVT